MVASIHVVADETANLGVLDLTALRSRWTELYGIAPTPRISRELLVRGVAFRIQEQASGGLGKSSRREIEKLTEVLRGGGVIPASQGQSFKLGTKLIREWKGRVHEVVIVAGGYTWNGIRYRSLSQIARSITGTRWSGPRFFGLENPRQAAATFATKQARPKALVTVHGSADDADG